MLEIGSKAPEFTLPDQNGEMHSLKDYRGKKVILSDSGEGRGCARDQQGQREVAQEF